MEIGLSSDAHLILEAIPRGTGTVIDLGGNKGMLRQPLQERGYHYINLDIKHLGNGEPSLIGDAHRLPFKDAAVDLVVSKDTLEHFVDPWGVMQKVHRVLNVGGKLIIWVPFMHPFHGDDFYRYSPLGLEHLLRDFEVVTFESPLWLFTVVGLAVNRSPQAGISWPTGAADQASVWWARPPVCPVSEAPCGLRRGISDKSVQEQRVKKTKQTALSPGSIRHYDRNHWCNGCS
jgi:SAM-dependent methyltransferase